MTVFSVLSKKILFLSLSVSVSVFSFFEKWRFLFFFFLVVQKIGKLKNILEKEAERQTPCQQCYSQKIRSIFQVFSPSFLSLFLFIQKEWTDKSEKITNEQEPQNPLPIFFCLFFFLSFFFLNKHFSYL